jgi:hypothetical protein
MGRQWLAPYKMTDGNSFVRMERSLSLETAIFDSSVLVTHCQTVAKKFHQIGTEMAYSRAFQENVSEGS